jgi:general secretion pathway protein L
MNARIDERLSGFLAPYGLRWRRFLSWWKEELAEMIPRWARRLSTPGRSIMVHVDGEHVCLLYDDASSTQSLGRFSFGGQVNDELARFLRQRPLPIDMKQVLLLPPGRVLRKTLVFPEAVTGNLRQVLAFQMDRETPFQADQVYYDYRVIEHLRTTRQVKVELAAVARNYADEVLHKLEHSGLAPIVITTVEPSHDGHLYAAPFNFFPAHNGTQVGQKDQLMRRANRVLGLSVLVLLVFVCVLPVLQRWQLRNLLQSKVATARAQVESVRRLEARVDELRAGADFLISKKAKHGSVLAVLNELSRVLPDDTWLVSLQLDGTTLRILGNSGAASNLIELLNASPMLSNPRFISPVTRNPVTGKEGFQISAEVVSQERQRVSP